jgi:hypothetical protein
VSAIEIAVGPPLAAIRTTGGQGDVGVTAVKRPQGGKTIAMLSASVNPTTCPSNTTTIDAAIAKALSMADTENFILGIGEVRGVRKVNTTYYPVMKSGAVTHRTQGVSCKCQPECI